MTAVVVTETTFPAGVTWKRLVPAAAPGVGAASEDDRANAEADESEFRRIGFAGGAGTPPPPPPPPPQLARKADRMATSRAALTFIDVMIPRCPARVPGA